MDDFRQQLINKSFQQFLICGYKSCTLRKLEEINNVTKGTIYYYFQNKEDLLRAGLEKYIRTYQYITNKEFRKIRSLQEYIEFLVKNKKERAERLYSVFHFHILEIAAFQLIREIGTRFHQYDSIIHKVSSTRLQRWISIIEKAKDSGEIQKSINTKILARNFFAVSTSIIHLDLNGDSLTLSYNEMLRQFQQYYELIQQ